MEQRKPRRYSAAVISDVQSVETPPANSSLNNPTHLLSKGAAESYITIPDLQTPDKHRHDRFNEILHCNLRFPELQHHE